MKRALSLDAVKLLISGVFVHRPLRPRIIAVHPGVKLIGSKKYFLAVADLQFLHVHDIDELSCHGFSSRVFGFMASFYFLRRSFAIDRLWHLFLSALGGGARACMEALSP
jgi:hypothetical protein